MLQISNSSIEARRPLTDYLIPIVIILGLAFGGYRVYNQPPEMPEPLMVTLDELEYLDSLFDANYDYSGFAHKSVEIFYPVNYDEFSQNRDETVTEYTSDSIEEAWSKLSLESPTIAKGLAEWLCNGTLDETGLRYYGDLRTFQTWASSEHITACIRGPDEKDLCEFSIYRGKYFFYDDILVDSFYDNPGEYVMIEKGYSPTGDGGTEYVWAYCVFIETEPVKSVLIQFPR